MKYLGLGLRPGTATHQLYITWIILPDFLWAFFLVWKLIILKFLSPRFVSLKYNKINMFLLENPNFVKNNFFLSTYFIFTKIKDF